MTEDDKIGRLIALVGWGAPIAVFLTGLAIGVLL